MPVIRMDTKNLKAMHGFTEGDAKTLGVYVTSETFDPNTYQPTLEATARHNYVELMAKKLGVDSLNLYWRPAGTADWKLLSRYAPRWRNLSDRKRRYSGNRFTQRECVRSICRGPQRP